jgi:hypothetical protein
MLKDLTNLISSQSREHDKQRLRHRVAVGCFCSSFFASWHRHPSRSGTRMRGFRVSPGPIHLGRPQLVCPLGGNPLSRAVRLGPTKATICWITTERL